VRSLAALLPLLAFSPGRAAAEEAGPASTPASAPASQRHPRAGRAAGPPATLPAPVYQTVVTGKRPLARDRTQSAALVQGSRLRDSARASTLEAISQEAADVYVSGRGVGPHGVASGSSGAIRIRGLGGSPNSQVLVVEDGVPDYQGIFGHPIPDAFVPFLIDQVMVVKGGDSVLHGTNALGGVVVIRSRWRKRPGHELLSDSAFGSYSTLRESVSLLARSGAWDLAAAFHGLKTDGHRQGAGGSDLVGHAAVRYRPRGSRLQITLRNKVVHVVGADPGPATHPTPDHWFDVWRNSASLQVAHVGGPLRVTLTPYLNAGIHRLHDGFFSLDLVAGGTGSAELRLHRLVSLELGLAGEQILGRVENRISGERPDVQPIADLSFYNQLSLRPLSSVTVVLGTRELYSSEYGFVLLYKAGLRWDLPGGLALRTRLARNFRQPTLRELYLPYPVANPELRPEIALNWDIGLDYRAGRLEISCNGYRTDARDLIKYFGAWPAAEVVNIDRLVIWGIEGRLGVKQLGPVSAYVAADWQATGRYTRQNPDAKLNFAVELSLPLRRHFLGAALSGEWVHGLYMADYQRRPIPDVFVADLALRYRYSWVRRGLALEPYLLLRNFLDRRYAYIEGYPMPGFNALFGLKLST
jgi:outer membrane cobalamin receptor